MFELMVVLVVITLLAITIPWYRMTVRDRRKREAAARAEQERIQAYQRANLERLVDFRRMTEPHEHIRDARSKRLEDTARQLARYELDTECETLARRANALIGRGAESKAELRRLGEDVAGLGGHWLMVLIAHRAQYISYPTWEEDRARRMNAVREQLGGNVAGILSSGPSIREFERAWQDICGWQPYRQPTSKGSVVIRRRTTAP